MKCAVINKDNKPVGDIDLNDSVFGVPTRVDLIARVVRWQRARWRSGNHETKGRSEVSGSNKKPFRQKGTGRARQGTKRAPQMRGGGVVFGPCKRDHSFSLPKKVRRLALRSMLSTRLAEGNLKVIDTLDWGIDKTKEMIALLDRNGWRSALFLDGERNISFCSAVGNIDDIHVLPQDGANVYSLLKSSLVIVSKEAVQHLEARLAVHA